MERSDLLLQIYQILPKLIDKAISLPDVKLSNSDDPIEEARDFRGRRGACPATRGQGCEEDGSYARHADLCVGKR